ncbi:MAG: prephenate dehydrogenase/arogenate dehydrogenase family protein [Candidatus Margulisbacteria bacterium]|nr:prephenate dehydrogenase/arogenate dehydrogenase family protein [Candidatus Margulisiibacteriota bacterium]
MKSFKKVAIIGLGLIGGSLGQRIIKKIPDLKVIGIPRRSVTIRQAKEKKAIHYGTLDIKAGVRQADLIIIATPIDLIIPKFKQIVKELKKGAVVVDVASTKTNIVLEAEAMCPSGVFFVGGHPMAGLEKTGIEVADHKILEKATFVLTKTKNTSGKALNEMIHFVKKLGMKPLILKPAVHDFMVAAISHLPYLVAVSLAGTVEEMKEYRKQLGILMAGGFRDTTRVASSAPRWGKEVASTNREQIIEVLNLYQKKLQTIRRLIDHRKFREIERLFTAAKKYRDTLYK